MKLSIEQVVSIAGEGRLLDGTVCSVELREFLSTVPADRIGEYIIHCLERSFDSSGFVLKDIVNELGRRLGFSVIDGFYHDRQGKANYDGLWRAEGIPEIIAETKTSSQFAISLDKLEEYKKFLVKEGLASQDASILIVVGREDTRSLEAQIRGSRYAWDTRLISIECLIKLASIKEKSSGIATWSKVRAVLRPFEYTKIDGIVDIIFETAQDIYEDVSSEVMAVDEAGARLAEARASTVAIDRTPQSILDAQRARAVLGYSRLNGLDLIQKGRRLFGDERKKLSLSCLISKRYENANRPYWYGFSSKMETALSSVDEAIVVLCATDNNVGYAIPYKIFREWLKEMNFSTNKDGGVAHWHVAIAADNGCDVGILLKNRRVVEISEFRYEF